MRSYNIQIAPAALSDIQNATDWYNEQLPNLGARFQKNVIKQINSLSYNFDGHAIRYGKVRCCLVKKFPFLIHFTVDRDTATVKIIAIFHTSRHPRIWTKRTKNT